MLPDFGRATAIPVAAIPGTIAVHANEMCRGSASPLAEAASELGRIGVPPVVITARFSYSLKG